MSTQALYRMSGISLLLGGILGITAHILHLPAPTDMSMLVHYTSKSQPAHVVLFFAVMFTLLGFPALLKQQGQKLGAIGVAGFVLMFFGITFADGMHCILQFSVFPVMAREIPTLTIHLVDLVYTTSPYAMLENAGGPRFMRAFANDSFPVKHSH